MKRALLKWIMIVLTAVLSPAILAQSGATVPPSGGSAVQWHETQREPAGKPLADLRQADGVEIFSAGGTITVRTSRRVTVRVFTILGQNVSQATFGPGTFELRLATRGIYLVKVGNMTQKVVV